MIISALEDFIRLPVETASTSLTPGRRFEGNLRG
jgi:hypothetical protein